MECSKNLREQFFSSLDMSKLLQDLGSLNRLQLLGRGYHFSSYLWNPGHFNYVLSVARKTFHSGNSWGADRWCKAMKKAQKISHPMIPPMEWGRYDDALYYISPYCPDRVSREEVDAQSLLDALREHGLRLDDYIQARARNGYIYVIDWSDLVFDDL